MSAVLATNIQPTVEEHTLVVPRVGSTPNLWEFNPNIIPTQMEVIDLIRYHAPKMRLYDNGPLEIMLSGSVGSAKSLLMAHLAVTHCLQYDRAKVCLGRKTLPDLKSTIFLKIIEHLEGALTEGVNYWVIKDEATIRFSNGSSIISRSWHDKKYASKFRSLDISMFIIEELTENTSEECKAFYTEAIARVGRLMHVPEAIVVAATNPDDPSHWAYDHFILGCKSNTNRFVFYSKTKDNPFLPKWYYDSLRSKYDRKMASRLLDGAWLYINTDVIYYEYDHTRHFGHDLKTTPGLPICFTFDFNIAKGKPMSSTVYQRSHSQFRFLDEVVIEGSRTLDQMEEWAAKGYLDLPGNPTVLIYGDATGRHADTRSNNSDYDIIDDFLFRFTRKDGQRLEYEIEVGLTNPSIRDRHNIVNGQLRSASGISSILIDKKCNTIDEGFRKTKLKDGSKYIEDDSASCPYQHITTAIGYGICGTLEDDGDFENITAVG